MKLGKRQTTYKVAKLFKPSAVNLFYLTTLFACPRNIRQTGVIVRIFKIYKKIEKVCKFS